MIEETTTLFGYVMLLKWKNKMFGIALKHRSFPVVRSVLGFLNQ
jgi:hypothetical protein